MLCCLYPGQRSPVPLRCSRQAKLRRFFPLSQPIPLQRRKGKRGLRRASGTGLGGENPVHCPGDRGFGRADASLPDVTGKQVRHPVFGAGTVIGIPRDGQGLIVSSTESSPREPLPTAEKSHLNKKLRALETANPSTVPNRKWLYYSSLTLCLHSCAWREWSFPSALPASSPGARPLGDHIPGAACGGDFLSLISS